MTPSMRDIFMNYPTARLPEDLRADLDDVEFVTITIDTLGFGSSAADIERSFIFRDGAPVLIDERRRG